MRCDPSSGTRSPDAAPRGPISRRCDVAALRPAAPTAAAATRSPLSLSPHSAPQSSTTTRSITGVRSRRERPGPRFDGPVRRLFSGAVPTPAQARHSATCHACVARIHRTLSSSPATRSAPSSLRWRPPRSHPRSMHLRWLLPSASARRHGASRSVGRPELCRRLRRRAATCTRLLTVTIPCRASRGRRAGYSENLASGAARRPPRRAPRASPTIRSAQTAAIAACASSSGTSTRIISTTYSRRAVRRARPPHRRRCPARPSMRHSTDRSCSCMDETADRRDTYYRYRYVPVIVPGPWHQFHLSWTVRIAPCRAVPRGGAQDGGRPAAQWPRDGIDHHAALVGRSRVGAGPSD